MDAGLRTSRRSVGNPGIRAEDVAHATACQATCCWHKANNKSCVLYDQMLARLKTGNHKYRDVQADRPKSSHQNISINNSGTPSLLCIEPDLGISQSTKRSCGVLADNVQRQPKAMSKAVELRTAGRLHCDAITSLEQHPYTQPSVTELKQIVSNTAETSNALILLDILDELGCRVSPRKRRDHFAKQMIALLCECEGIQVSPNASDKKFSLTTKELEIILEIQNKEQKQSKQIETKCQIKAKAAKQEHLKEESKTAKHPTSHNAGMASQSFLNKLDSKLYVADQAIDSQCCCQVYCGAMALTKAPRWSVAVLLQSHNSPTFS